MGGPHARLATFLVALAAGLVAFSLLDVVDTADVQDTVDRAGVLAPVVFVPVSAVLGCLLVPGPVLAGASGALFGTATGTVVTLCSSVSGAVLGLWIARWAGRDAAAALGGERFAALSRAVERHGLGAVVAQRLAPGIADAPCTYAFGVLGLQTWQIAVGTAVGSAPRAFSYTAIGASLDDPTSPSAIAGAAVLVVVTVVGALVARRVIVRARRGESGLGSGDGRAGLSPGDARGGVRPGDAPGGVSPGDPPGGVSPGDARR